MLLKNKLLLHFSLVLLSLSALSQENTLKATAQYRLRTEYRHGYKTLTPDSAHAAFFLAQRARLAFEFKNQKISSYFSIQDSRTWGDEEQLKDNAGLSVNELWIEIPVTNTVALKAGRQELIYDDQRLLGNSDWGNVTRSHDALLMKYTDSSHKFFLHAGGALNQSGEPLFETPYLLKNYKYLQFIWMKKQSGHHAISLIEILNGMNASVPSSTNTKSTLTIGPLYNFQNTHCKVLLGAYYQTGKTESDQQVSAYMLNAYAEQNFKMFFAGLGFDALSGNSIETSTATSHNFSTLYATNHKFYGGMDYFINFPADTKQRGLTDIYLKIGMQQKQLKATIDFHHFLLAHEFSSTISNKTLGEEIDLLLDYKFNTVITLQTGYSMMFATSTMEKLKNGNKNKINNWVYLMLKVTPGFSIH